MNKLNLELLKTLLWLVLLGMSSGVTYAQSSITGVVKDESGHPIEGVVVKVKGGEVTTRTNSEGEFLINSTLGSVLVFTHLGYKELEHPIRSLSAFDIVLPYEINVLDDVVVIGYGSVKKSDLTGAVSSLSGKVLEKAPPNSFQAAMAGKLAGVNISQIDASPGAGMNILIRGGNTLTGGNQPLYVIDGFPLLPDQVNSADENASNPLADISPSMIASIEVLKDASATAIYGSAGSNGVVLITTKSGGDRPQVDIVLNSTTMALSNMPNTLTPEQYVNYKVGMAQSELYLLSNTKETNENALRTWKLRRNDFYNDPDSYKGKVWIDEITRHGKANNAEVSFSNSSKDNSFRYRVGTSFFDQEGVILNTKFQRKNINLNLSQKIGSRLTLDLSSILSQSLKKGLVDQWGSSATVKRAMLANPFQPENWSYVRDGAIDDPLIFESTADNISKVVRLTDNNVDETRTFANLGATYKISNAFTFYTSYGINRRMEDKGTFKSPELRAYVTMGGGADFIRRNYDNWVYQARLQYNKQIEKHSFNVVGVFESRENTSKYFRSGVQNFQESERGIWDLSTATQALMPMSNLYQRDAMLSYLSRLVYSYDSKYLLTASMRRDGSSRFGIDNKWGNFPSLALGWVVNRENFFQDVNYINFLKLRLSYGVTGNNQIGNYLSLSQMASVLYPFGDDVNLGFVHSSIANRDLRWEKTAQYNGGVDLNLFKNRLQFTGEVYYKKTTDLLLEVQVPMSSGYTTAVQNIGELNTRGYELSLTSVNISKPDFEWNTTLTHSVFRNKIVSLGDKDEMFFLNNIFWGMSNNVMLRTGRSTGTFFGYIEDGVLNSKTEIANSPDQSGVLTNNLGEMKYVDVNGDGLITDADKVPIGNSLPKFTGGLNNEFRYKSFDLAFFLRWSVGNDVINGNTSYMTDNYRNWNTTVDVANNVWGPDRPNNNSTGMTGTFWMDDMRSSLVEDGSFLKVDYITLGYTLPSTLTNRLRVRSLRVFARADNPFIFSRYTWFDPEVSTGWGTVAQIGPGVDLSSYPRSSGGTIGLNISF